MDLDTIRFSVICDIDQACLEFFLFVSISFLVLYVCMCVCICSGQESSWWDGG